MRAEARGTGLGVPAQERREILPAAIAQGTYEIFDAYGLAVVAGKVEVGTLPEGGGAEQGMHHANDFGTLFVHRRRVKVVDFFVGIGANRMCELACILGKLGTAQTAHIANALYPAGIAVGGKLLIAKDRKTFLEAQLKPVAQGNPVARPIMKIFVGNYRFDALVIGISGGFRTGQHIFGIENIEALVFHGPHIEAIRSNDQIAVEIVFATVDLLIPSHGLLQTAQGLLAGVPIALGNVDFQTNFAPGLGAEGILGNVKRPAHRGKQVTRLGKRIFPARPMPAFVFFARCYAIAIGE